MKNYCMRIVRSIGIMAFMGIMPAMILADPAFNLKNKLNDPIKVRIGDGKLMPVAANGTLEIKELDVTKVYKMYIFYCPTKSYCKNKKPDMLLADFGPGGVLGPIKYKTMYLKFSVKKGKGHLEPQKGSDNKTSDKYSLTDNIKEDDDFYKSMVKYGVK
jgi:hypothetical protein